MFSTIIDFLKTIFDFLKNAVENLEDSSKIKKIPLLFALICGAVGAVISSLAIAYLPAMLSGALLLGSAGWALYHVTPKTATDPAQTDQGVLYIVIGAVALGCIPFLFRSLFIFVNALIGLIFADNKVVEPQYKFNQDLRDAANQLDVPKITELLEKNADMLAFPKVSGNNAFQLILAHYQTPEKQATVQAILQLFKTKLSQQTPLTWYTVLNSLFYVDDNTQDRWQEWKQQASQFLAHPSQLQPLSQTSGNLFKAIIPSFQKQWQVFLGDLTTYLQQQIILPEDELNQTLLNFIDAVPSPDANRMAIRKELTVLINHIWPSQGPTPEAFEPAKVLLFDHQQKQDATQKNTKNLAENALLNKQTRPGSSPSR